MHVVDMSNSALSYFKKSILTSTVTVAPFLVRYTFLYTSASSTGARLDFAYIMNRFHTINIIALIIVMLFIICID